MSERRPQWLPLVTTALTVSPLATHPESRWSNWAPDTCSVLTSRGLHPPWHVSMTSLPSDLHPNVALAGDFSGHQDEQWHPLFSLCPGAPPALRLSVFFSQPSSSRDITWAVCSLCLLHQTVTSAGKMPGLLSLLTVWSGIRSRFYHSAAVDLEWFI